MTLSRRAAVAAGIAAAIAGCSGGGGDGTSIGTGTLSVSLMDAPVDGVTEVHVKITSIWLKSAGDGPATQLEMPNGPVTLNLLELTDQNAAVLVDSASVPAGDYEWLAMDIEAVANVDDSFVVDSAGSRHELSVPSDRLRLVSGFEVGANQATRYLIDWDLRTALVHPPGLGRYLLRPAFRVLEAEALGIVTGTVESTLIDASCMVDDAASVDTGNVVYVFAGNGVTPDEHGRGRPATGCIRAREASRRRLGVSSRARSGALLAGVHVSGRRRRPRGRERDRVLGVRRRCRRAGAR